MTVGSARFVRSRLTPVEQREAVAVDRLAGVLLDFLRRADQEIAAVHIHGASSGAVQQIVARLLTKELGFLEEVVIPARAGFSTRARPDFVYRLGPGRGILAEVERGGTTTNNHDLKDVWKAHIAPDAQHLFLIVPNANWNGAGLRRERPFNRVVQRVGSFFGDPRREVDIMTAHVFGYGPDSPLEDALRASAGRGG